MIDIAQKINDEVDSFLSDTSPNINWDNIPENSKWSNKEIIGHLIDSAHVNLQRFVRCTYSENFKLTYDQVEWVEAQHYQESDINELLMLWKALNMQIIRVLKNYPTNRLQTQCDNSKTEPSLHTVEWLAADYVAHMQHHLKQLN